MTMRRTEAYTWVPAATYGRGLAGLTLNLLVPDVQRSLSFYSEVLGLTVEYSDVDFAALAGPDDMRLMLHADHTYETIPLRERLTPGAKRGAGVEIRLLGLDPDAAERRARENGASVLVGVQDYPHGWRACYLEDPDGYVFAIGLPTSPSGG